MKVLNVEWLQKNCVNDAAMRSGLYKMPNKENENKRKRTV